MKMIFVSNESHEKDSPASGSPCSESNEDDLPILSNMRVRRTPSWMIDFETGEGLSDEDDLNVMLMLTTDDPLTYKEVVKRKKMEGCNNNRD